MNDKVSNGGVWYVENPERIVVDDRKVACDGGGGALGHPKVWYDMGEDDKVECKYCDRVFVLKGGKYDTTEETAAPSAT
ncbi:MAG: zinc-finger domain-containing protein [Hyphomonadaceae bacterium]